MSGVDFEAQADDTSNVSILQTLSFPAIGHADRLPLFARWPQGGVGFADVQGKLRLEKASVLDLGTFYNAFSRKKWIALTGLQSLAVGLEGHGRVRIRVFSIFHSALRKQVASCEANLDEGAVTVPLPPLDSLPGEILGCEIEALDDDVVLAAGSWRTTEKPKRAVRLAAIITTFEREAALEAVVESFSRQTMSRLAPEDLHLFVIDNGNTVNLPTNSRLTLVRNKNLGGSGGFTRGLLAARATGRYTHCLFMDDDASCEPEAVWRTMMLLAFMHDARCAVAGAMLLQDSPTIQAEKGASLALDGSAPWYYQAMNHYWNMADADAVACNDDPDQGNYGAWWFFAFPLAEVRHLPFPFFVRGDDVDFSLTNEFPVITMNGIAARCASFSTKLASSTEFLASRAWFALSLMHGDERCARVCLKRLLSHAFRFGVRFDYGAMEATIKGLEFVMRGPNAFADEPAPIERLKAVKAGFSAEAVTDEMIEQAQWAAHRSRLKARLIKFLYYGTLGGHLLPDRKRKWVVIYAREAWDVDETALMGADTFVFGQQDKTQCMKRDGKRMRLAMREWLRLYFTSSRKLKELQSSYKAECKAMRTPEYWQRQFQVE